MPGYFAVTLRRSGLGRKPNQRATLEGLGLRRVGQVVVLKDTPAIRGMLYTVVHLVDVSPATETPSVSRRQAAVQKRRSHATG